MVDDEGRLNSVSRDSTNNTRTSAPASPSTKVQLGIANAISKVQLDSSLPKRELQRFNGEDITKFKSFIINFDRIIASRCTDDGDKLLYLQ